MMTKCDNSSIVFSLLCDNHRNVHISLSPTTEYLSDATSLICCIIHCQSTYPLLFQCGGSAYQHLLYVCRIGLCARDYGRVMVGMVLT